MSQESSDTLQLISIDGLGIACQPMVSDLRGNSLEWPKGETLLTSLHFQSAGCVDQSAISYKFPKTLLQ